MTLYVPVGGAWSGAVAPGRVWVRNGANWERVRRVYVREDLTTGTPQWTQVYYWAGLGPALVAPTGSVVTYIDSTEVRLVVDNRFETWRIVGVVEVYSGGLFVSSTPINVLADSYSVADPGVVNGEVRFTVFYRNPDTGLDGPSATLSAFIGSES